MSTHVLERIFGPFCVDQIDALFDHGLKGLAGLSIQEQTMANESQGGVMNEDDGSNSEEDSVLFVGSKDGILVESLAFLGNYNNSRRTLRMSSQSRERAKDYRRGSMTIEWIDQLPMENPSSSSTTSPVNEDSDLLPFVSGYTEIHTGILHLYRDRQSIFTSQLPLEGKVLCVLAVPSYMTPADFLKFMGPFKAEVSHYRLIRDSQKNKFMVLLKFTSSDAATDFFSEYNGRLFNSLEAEVCYIVRIKSIQTSSKLPQFVFPSCNDFDETSLAELPTCPVCLERMDASVSGLLTTICHHTFHCTCLSNWADSTCPVCRYSERVNASSINACEEEDSEQQSLCEMCSTIQNLWICLICGHVGCGRYQQAHAYSHYLETGHLYAMELETQRVWDYAGDGYVHRLIQTKTDGKLVELPSANSTHSPEKLDDLALEFTHLLTSSLEAQRIHFESQLNEATSQLNFYQNEWKTLERRVVEMVDKQRILEGSNDSYRHQTDKQEQIINELSSSLSHLESINKKLSSKLNSLTQKLQEEEAIGKNLIENQGLYEEKIKSLEYKLSQKDNEIEELQEQVRDLMVFLEAKDKISQITSDDIAQGVVKLAEPLPKKKKSKNKK